MKRAFYVRQVAETVHRIIVDTESSDSMYNAVDAVDTEWDCLNDYITALEANGVMVEHVEEHMHVVRNIEFLTPDTSYNEKVQLEDYSEQDVN